VTPSPGFVVSETKIKEQNNKLENINLLICDFFCFTKKLIPVFKTIIPKKIINLPSLRQKRLYWEYKMVISFYHEIKDEKTTPWVAIQ
jgi:hypothetical protein